MDVRSGCRLNEHIEEAHRSAKMANAFRRMLRRIGLQPRPKIDRRVSDKLEELGIDAVRSKLVWIMNVRTLSQQDDCEDLGDGVSASRRQMQEWLKKRPCASPGGLELA